MSVIIKEDNTDKVVAGIGTAIERALEKIGLVGEGHAKKICPVDTGRLRNSITHVVDSGGKFTAIGTNVEYGPYIELGHHTYPGANGGKGYLRPAATEHASEYRQILESELKGS
ncbi:MAG: HK97 gp10 family phage protein [Eggerthellaceae bacterium]|nr:HK97 gp10 family phage protein [Eggerthellaceae bacterium]